MKIRKYINSVFAVDDAKEIFSRLLMNSQVAISLRCTHNFSDIAIQFFKSKVSGIRFRRWVAGVKILGEFSNGDLFSCDEKLCVSSIRRRSYINSFCAVTNCPKRVHEKYCLVPV